MPKNSDFFKCFKCGELFPWSKAHECPTKGAGERRYICDKCNIVHGYHRASNDMEAHGVRKNDGFTVSMELEAFPKNAACHSALMADIYGFTAEHDGSLHSWEYGEGVEYHTPIYNKLHGIKQALRSVEDYAVLNAPECGHHINVGLRDKEMMEYIGYIREYASLLFDSLGEYLADNPEKTEKVFGRKLCHYANYIPGVYMRGFRYPFINVSNDTHVEFRLPHYVNANQYFACVNMCVDMVKAIFTWFINKDRTVRDARMAGKKIVEIFEKYANGKAPCQSERRNNHRNGI